MQIENLVGFFAVAVFLVTVLVFIPLWVLGRDKDNAD